MFRRKQLHQPHNNLVGLIPPVSTLDTVQMNADGHIAWSTSCGGCIKRYRIRSSHCVFPCLHFPKMYSSIAPRWPLAARTKRFTFALASSPSLRVRVSFLQPACPERLMISPACLS